MAPSISDAAWMEWVEKLMGVASRQPHTATLPMQKFHCLLDELPIHLVPGGFLPSRREDSRSEPILNFNCSVLAAGSVPSEFQSRMDLLEGFHLQHSIAWVREPFTNSLHPFWLGPRFESVISDLRGGHPAISSLTTRDKLLLQHAGILSAIDSAEKRSDERQKLVAAARLFSEKNYAPLGNLIHPFNLAALRRYYRHAIRRGAIRLGDEQSSRRYVAHNEPVARYFQHQIANTVSVVVGEPVKPSYVYLASYMSGAELKKHIDREQCEFSVTLCLDFSPEPKQATSWPICLQTRVGTVTVYQALGDGLVYRGTKVPHYRSVLRDGYSSTSIFFHYVPADFSGSLN
jgi:hypothetical protein